MADGGTRTPHEPEEISFEDRTDPRFRDRLGDRLDAMVPETVKKLALAGLGAVFMTEEGIRSAVSDLKLPREAVATLLSQTDKARVELFRVIATELRRFLEDANLAGELRKVLIGLSVDVQASISFRSTDDERIEHRMEVGSSEVARKKPRASPKAKKKRKKTGTGKGGSR